MDERGGGHRKPKKENDKFYALAVRFFVGLANKNEAQVIGKQILRSGTAVRAKLS
jgi:hypothetical protein